MSEKNKKRARKIYKQAIHQFAETKIGKIINKKMFINKIIIICQWITIAVLIGAVIILSIGE